MQESKSNRWQNEGYWLLYPLAILILFWFRRGWTIQWLTGFLLFTLLWQPPAIAAEIPSSSSTNLSSRFINLWLTPDQQGRFFWLYRTRYAKLPSQSLKSKLDEN